MRASKSTFSIGRAQNDGSEHQLQRSRTRSSLDTLVIPGRIRIPSAREPAAVPFDLKITRELLSPGSFNVPPQADPSVPKEQLSETDQPQLVHPLKIGRLGQLRSQAFDGPDDGETPSRFTSATWTTISNRVFTDSSGRSFEREAADFVGEYNRLAQKHGLPTIAGSPGSGVHGSEQTDDKNTSVRPQRSNWFLRKFLRKAASTHNVKSPAKKPLARKLSVASIPDRGRKDTLKDRSLEELARLGGISIFVLPPAFAAARLAIPTCFSATATYLSQHGRTAPGIFRVPGQLSTVNALYDHYAHQVEHAEKAREQVQQTVGSGLLPTHIIHNVHDVASAFKKFIAGLPGGILGSKSLLETLKDINTLLKPNPDLPESQKTKLRARLIALAIASLTSDHQIALISSVLGLTALIARAAEEAGNSNEQEPASSVAELMTCRSLGVVFGPLLFGNRTQEINLTPEHSRGSLLAVPRSPQKRRKDRRRKTDCPKKLDNGGLALNVERAKLTAGIMEMLVSDWEDVVRQFRNIGVTELQHTMPGPKTHAIAGNSELGVQSEDEPMQNQLPGDIEGSLVIKKSRSKGQPFVDSLVTTWHLDNESGGRNMPAQIATNLEKNSEIISPSQITLIGDRGINDQSTLLWTLDEPETADRSQAHPTTNSSHEIYCEAETWPRDLSVADARKETTDPDIKAERPKFDSQEHEFGTEQKRKKDLIDMSSAIQPTPPLNERWYPSMLRESFEQLGLQGLEQSKSCEGDPGAIPDANVLIENSASSNGACGDTLASSEDGKAKLTQNQIKNAPLLADNPSTPPPEPGCGLEHTPPIAQGLVTPRIGRNSIRAFSDLPNKSIPIRQSSLSRSPQKHVVTPTKQIEIIQRSTSLSSISPSTNMPRFNVLPRSLTVSSADKLSKTLPINEEPPIAQHIQFRYSAERLRSRSDTSSQQDLSLASSSKGNATLYAEIRRLQRQVELRTEEAHQAHRQLEAMRNYRDSGTLSEKLREVQRGLKTWKNRAEWAEKRLLMQDCERRRSFAAADISEHALIEESEKESRRATMI